MSSLLDLPPEFRLHIYQKIAGEKDPATTLIFVRRVCKFISIEVSGEMVRWTTAYLEALQCKLNNFTSMKLRISKPRISDEIRTITVSLPLLAFMRDSNSTAVPCTFWYRSTLSRIAELHREELNIVFYQDGEVLSEIDSYMLCVDRLGHLCLYLLVLQEDRAFMARVTTLNWNRPSITPGLDLAYMKLMQKLDKKGTLGRKVSHGLASVSWHRMVD